MLQIKTAAPSTSYPIISADPCRATPTVSDSLLLKLVLYTVLLLRETIQQYIMEGRLLALALLACFVNEVLSGKLARNVTKNRFRS